MQVTTAEAFSALGSAVVSIKASMGLCETFRVPEIPGSSTLWTCAEKRLLTHVTFIAIDWPLESIDLTGPRRNVGSHAHSFICGTKLTTQPHEAAFATTSQLSAFKPHAGIVRHKDNLAVY
jgi:hypothetical protein